MPVLAGDNFVILEYLVKLALLHLNVTEQLVGRFDQNFLPHTIHRFHLLYHP